MCFYNFKALGSEVTGWALNWLHLEASDKGIVGVMSERENNFTVCVNTL